MPQRHTASRCATAHTCRLAAAVAVTSSRHCAQRRRQALRAAAQAGVAARRPSGPSDRRMRADQRAVLDLLTRLPNRFAGCMMWLAMVPPGVPTAKDRLTCARELQDDEDTPDLLHLMKARHFALTLMKARQVALTGRIGRIGAHADSVIALVEPALRSGSDAGSLLELLTQRSTLAEAYAYAGRPADAARVIDEYVED